MHLYGQALAIVDPIRIKMWSEAELTTSQLRILFVLYAEPGSPLGYLAAQLRVSPPTASGLVDRLVRQGYVRREDDTQDRRVVRHRLTERGLSVAAAFSCCCPLSFRPPARRHAVKLAEAACLIAFDCV